MSVKTLASQTHENYDDYPVLEHLVRARIAEAPRELFYAGGNGYTESLYDIYLREIPAPHWQHYNCRACRDFVNRYGMLVTISADGATHPLLWNPTSVPKFFERSFAVLDEYIRRAPVVGVFYQSAETWGRPVTKGWTHLSGVYSHPFYHPLMTDSQREAEKVEEYGMLRRGLAEFDGKLVGTALAILETDMLVGGEKAVGIARWLADLHARISTTPSRKAQDNFVWLAVASAPPGFCHVRSTMIGTLLSDLAAGLPVEVAKRRWAEKMHPLQYRRPTKISDGAVEQAERVFAATGAAPALKRRYARLDDVLPYAIWSPPSPEPTNPPAKASVFGHLRSVAKADGPPVTAVVPKITWRKFYETVLNGSRPVLAIAALVPPRGGFYGLTVAEDQAAPPILQWDGLPGMPRNSAAWYFYHGGSAAINWGLVGDMFVKVTAIFGSPAHWQVPTSFEHFEKRIHLALEGCADKNKITGHRGGLFPNCLKAEYHGVRQVIEAHERNNYPSGADEGSANGLAIDSAPGVVVLKVTTADLVADYHIDRLD